VQRPTRSASEHDPGRSERRQPHGPSPLPVVTPRRGGGPPGTTGTCFAHVMPRIRTDSPSLVSSNVHKLHHARRGSSHHPAHGSSRRADAQRGHRFDVLGPKSLNLPLVDRSDSPLLVEGPSPSRDERVAVRCTPREPVGMGAITAPTRPGRSPRRQLFWCSPTGHVLHLMMSGPLGKAGGDPQWSSFLSDDQEARCRRKCSFSCLIRCRVCAARQFAYRQLVQYHGPDGPVAV
jgi:hypothetical protein